jgi:glycosyltransferase involved in cell wall biosynthesis
MTQPPSISILIRTYNSERTLEEVLNSLPLRLDDEIIIVDSGSNDATTSIANRFQARILHTRLPFNYSRSLNEGFQVSRNPWILVMSSHCIPVGLKLLERMREFAAQADPRVVVAYGGIGLSLPKKIQCGIEIGGMDDWIQGRFRIGGNCLALYRKDLWSQHQFDENLLTAEDLAWFLWAAENGHLAANVRDAFGLYRNQGSFRHMFRKGLLESQVASGMIKKQIPHRTVLQKLFSFSINLAHLGKLYLLRRVSFLTFSRQVAHAAGVFYASITETVNDSAKLPASEADI